MNPVQAEVTDERSVSQSVIETIAEVDGTDPLELTPPLQNVVDPDALETLFADGQTLGKVIFNYGSYEVSVFSDGYVSVDDAGR